MKRQMFEIKLNYESTGHCIPASLRDAKRWIKEHVTSTHMGGWVKTRFGYEYVTTIGRYYQFFKVNKGA